MSENQNIGSSSSSGQPQYVVNVMDIDIDEEQEKEAREYELQRQNTAQRLAELKKNASSSERISSMMNSGTLNSSSLSSMNASNRMNTSSNNNNGGKYISTIVKYNSFANVQKSNGSSSPHTTTIPNVSLSKLPLPVSRPPGHVPQKFIPPPRKDSQTNSQKSSTDSANTSSCSNSQQTMNFALKPQTPTAKPVNGGTVESSTTPVKSNTYVPPFSSSSPSSVTSSSPSASINSSTTSEFNIPFPITATSITANAVQKKNPITKHIREGAFKVNYVPEWKLTDFILGKHTTALYVSLKYHMTNPRFILERIRNFHKTEVCKNKLFTVKVVLVNVDVSIEASHGNSSYFNSDNDEMKPKGTPTFVSESALDEALIEITRICMWGDWTMLCAFSDEECALYLESLRYCENKSASTIQGPIQAVPSLATSMSTPNAATKKKSGKKKWSKERYVGSSSSSSNNPGKSTEVEKISHTEEVHQLFALSFKRTLNKRDHVTLLNHFGSVKEVIQTSADELTDLPGFGKKKVKRLINLFQTPFIPGKETKSNTSNEKKETKKKIQLVRKSRTSTASNSSSSNNQESDDDDILVVNNETGEEEKIRKTTKKQTNLSIFFSQPQTKSETQDSDEEE
ncbi:hypothetical protein FDP41_000696 [Naegleria fowleri]|uniref:ERCC1-like central domain-containing protein n=1 Tax=Naegleria fowleri TaxID=5763 RepID=A0A6A5C676_NAEFO|nr:uncharacterized protein FDP41_000696 [Naegleria fowleri]KAF0984797.1 hypothetical protein FDP41_000696 [Naegleria fowleri]